jgi:hypothetical protein
MFPMVARPVSRLLAQAAPTCPDLSSFTPAIDRLAGLLAAAIGAFLLVNVLHAGLVYAHAHGRMEEVMKSKSILKHTAIGLGIAGLGVPIVALLVWLVGGTICGH